MKKWLMAAALLAIPGIAFADIIEFGRAADAEKYASQLVEKYRLTTNRLECLTFETDNRNTFYLVRVREYHKPKCGGDPETAPTLFFMKIRKKDGKATTDAYDGDEYIPIDEAARKIAARRAKKTHQQRSND